MKMAVTTDSHSNSWLSNSFLTLTVISLCSTAVNPSISLLRIADENSMNETVQDILYSSAMVIGMVNVSTMIAGALAAFPIVKIVMNCFSHGQIVALIHVAYMLGHGLIFVNGIDNFWAMACGRCLNGFALGTAAALFEAIFNETQTLRKKRFFSGAILGSSYHMGTTFAFSLCLPLIFSLPSLLWAGMLAFELLSSYALLKFAQWMAGIESNGLTDHEKDSPKLSDKLQNETYAFRRRLPFYGMAIFSCIMACAMTNYLFQLDKILMSVGWPFEYVLCFFAGMLVLGASISLLGSVAVKQFSPHSVLILGIALVISSEAIVSMATTSRQYLSPNLSSCLMASACMFLTGFSVVCTIACGIIEPLLYDLCPDQPRISFTAFVSIFWIVGWLVGLISSALKILIGMHTFAIWIGIAVVLCITVVFCAPNDVIQIQGNRER